MFCACQEKELFIEEMGDEQENIDREEILDIDSPDYQAGVSVALIKAEQLAGLTWTPLAKIKKTRPEGAYYMPGVTYQGTPYSSVKELDKFIGQDVSFHTFLSALSNPRSVLYTEIVNQSPYHGVNCAPYYGIVCSMAINYALGIDAPYPSWDYAKVSFMKKVTDDDIDKMSVCDVLARNGHALMVIDYQKDEDGKIVTAKFLENGGYHVFDRDSLYRYWINGNFALYRYKRMAQNRYYQEIEPAEESPAVCVQRGDKSIFREGEVVVLNVLNESYPEIELYRYDRLVEKRIIDSIDMVFPNLQEGMYKARLTNNLGNVSSYTRFEVRKINVDITKANNKIHVFFRDNSIPATAIELCEITGQHLYTSLINEKERMVGETTAPLLESAEPYYCKVIFQGQYGKIVSEYIQIN